MAVGGLLSERIVKMKEKEDKLKERRFYLSKCITLNNALNQIKAGSLCHDTYRHYTSLKALLGMINSGSMWLTLGKSAKLDDAQERQKYGTDEMWKRTYLASFVHDIEESAAMWGLYCKGSEQAVCVSFSREAIKSWSIALHKIVKKGEPVLINPQNKDNSIRKPVEKVDVLDVAYADVARSGFSDRVRQNFVSWDGIRSKKIASLKADVECPDATGMLKDYEWNFEHETRVLVRLKDVSPYASKIALPLPSKMFECMSVTFGPLLIDGDKDKFEKKIEDVLHGKGLYEHVPVFESSLLGALPKWECGII